MKKLLDLLESDAKTIRDLAALVDKHIDGGGAVSGTRSEYEDEGDMLRIAHRSAETAKTRRAEIRELIEKAGWRVSQFALDGTWIEVRRAGSVTRLV